MSDGPAICEPGGKGLVFPLLESEQNWPDPWRAVLYAVALCYIFMGVGIVADKFMESIEMITCQKVRVRDNKTGQIVTMKKWNDTVANLTLLALGSSAPEILLSIMEIVLSEFHAGVLGPSTIVGSAAFNLFVIVAVCIYVIPTGEKRTIKEYNVFLITAGFSIVAYLWLVFIVQVNSRDVVEPWEGCCTLAFFPVLVVISYMADIGYFKSVESEDLALEHAALEGPTNCHPRLGSATSAPCISPAGSRRCAPKGAEPEPDPIYEASLGGKPGKVMVNPAGILSFEQDMIEVLGAGHTKIVKVPVLRCNGSEGAVTCKYRLENRAGTATPGRDYTDDSGELLFSSGEHTVQIQLEILKKRRWEVSDSFQLLLEEPTGGATFNPHNDGGRDSCVLTVKILNANERKRYKLPERAMGMVDDAFNLDRASVCWDLWKASIAESVKEPVLEEGEIDSVPAKFLHMISLPWNFVFAVLIPPAEYAGGWICFGMALVFIGGITAIIMDFAQLFGCVTGLDDSITAITFVALGTSMPDLFASKKAACGDLTADASIINVTGSNSVNVFLGIGIPWTIASIYWMLMKPTGEWMRKYGDDFLGKYPNGAFIVKGGDLGFSVMVFVIGALIAFALLRARRVYTGGELGGATGSKTLSAIILGSLWFFYVALSFWKVQNPDASASTQVLVIIVSVIALENLVMVIGGILKFSGALDETKPSEDFDTKLAALEEGPSGPDGKRPSMAMHDMFDFEASPHKQHLPSGFHGGAPCKQQGLAYDSIDLDFDDDDDEEDHLLSFHAVLLVCLAVARLKRRRIKRRQLLGLHEAPPPLPPPAYSPSPSTSSRLDAGPRPVVFGRPLQQGGPAGIGQPIGTTKPMSFTTAAMVSLAVAKMRSGRLSRERHAREIAARQAVGRESFTAAAAVGLAAAKLRGAEEGRPMSFTTAAMTCLAVAKLRRGMARAMLRRSALQQHGGLHPAAAGVHFPQPGAGAGPLGGSWIQHGARSDADRFPQPGAGAGPPAGSWIEHGAVGFHGAAEPGLHRSPGLPWAAHGAPSQSPTFHATAAHMQQPPMAQMQPPQLAPMQPQLDPRPQVIGAPLASPSGAPESITPAAPAPEQVAPRANPVAAASTWVARFLSSHVADFVAVGVCAYAAGHLGQPALGT